MQPKRKRQRTPKSKSQIRQRGEPQSPLNLNHKRGEKMQRITLRKYLLAKRVELYEQVNTLKDKLLSDNFTERDTINLEVAEGKLNLIKEIIEICTEREKF